MGISKDKRIKKLKKNSMWPSIVGLMVMLGIMALFLYVVLVLGCVDVLQQKVIQSREESVKIADLYKEAAKDEWKNINKSVITYTELSDVVEVVCILDSNKKPVWSSNNSYPKEDMRYNFELLEGTEHDTKVVVEEDKHNMLVVDKKDIIINEKLYTNISKFVDSENAENESDCIHEFKLWYSMPLDDGTEILVLNRISVYDYDLVMFVVTVGIFIVLIIIFVIYYIISLVSFVYNTYKTTTVMYTDMITGGDNWISLVKKGTQLLKSNKKHKKYNYVMLYVSMRKYRSFCTCFGVREGEELIEKMYQIMSKDLKKKEVMAHNEDSQFGVLLTYTNKDELISRINTMLSKLENTLPNMKIYFSIGITFIECGEMNVEQMYNNSIIACENLGEEAEHQIAYYDVEMNKQKLWERKVEDDMDRALANREFQVYLQPKINAMKEELAGAEALVRWIHPTEGFIPPNRFIPIFEQNGFILKLDDYMLEEIAMQQSKWIEQGIRTVPISVNISRAHFTREDLAEHICEIVDKYDVPHNLIELELTESAFFDDKLVLLNTVKKLRESDFIVSMDDFGAGYSSLNSLKELCIDVLKIDADFFRGEDVQERGMLIVSEVIGLAKKLGMKIVAEGIESREQVDFLIEQECDLIQGYFFAKPMPIDEYVKKYANNTNKDELVQEET